MHFEARAADLEFVVAPTTWTKPLSGDDLAINTPCYTKEQAEVAGISCTADKDGNALGEIPCKFGGEAKIKITATGSTCHCVMECCSDCADTYTCKTGVDLTQECDSILAAAGQAAGTSERPPGTCVRVSTGVEKVSVPSYPGGALGVLSDIAARESFDFIANQDSTEAADDYPGALSTPNVHVSVIPDVCATAMDIVFVVDASNSIKDLDWFKTKDFVKQVVVHFALDSDAAADQTRVAFVPYSGKFDLRGLKYVEGTAVDDANVFTFKDFNTEEQILCAIDRVGRFKGERPDTYTGRALQ